MSTFQQGSHHHGLYDSHTSEFGTTIYPLLAVNDENPLGLYLPHIFEGTVIPQYLGLEPQECGKLENEQAFDPQYDMPSGPVLSTAAPESQVTRPRKLQTRENSRFSFRLPLTTVCFS
jgi:hypothetical protein